MKAILKEIVFRSPLNFIYIIVVVLSCVGFTLSSGSGSSFAVWCWVCLLVFGVSDRRQVMLERGLPIRKERIADARYLFMLVILLIVTAASLWQGVRTGSWGMAGIMTCTLFFSCGLWLLGALGIGGKAVSWFSLAVFTCMLLGILFGRRSFAPAIGIRGAAVLALCGIGSYIAFWIVSRRMIGKAEP